MVLPESLRQAVGLPKEIEVNGTKYKAFPLTSMELIEFYDILPITANKEVSMSGQTLKAHAYAVFVTLKKQFPEMKNDTFNGFLLEVTDLMGFVNSFSPLIEAVIIPSQETMQKKN